MEPVTHMLTGACLSRAGLNRRAAYATLTMVIAAEFPDIDTLWSLRGPIEGFQHHRGITHAFLGLPFEAALIVAGVYGWHRWRLTGQARNRSKPRRTPAAAQSDIFRPNLKSLAAAPVRWGLLYLFALVALISHLLLDYTNNYGLRPFFPFDDKWYAASIVFIFDPVMFMLLLGALVAPWMFALISSEVGAKKLPFRSRGWAVAALLAVVAWWGLREVEHGHAVSLAMAESIAAPPSGPSPMPPASVGSSEGTSSADPIPAYLPARKVVASPDPLNPFHWSAAIDFGPVYQMGEIDTRSRTITMGDTTYPKPDRDAAVLAAERSKLGRIYMDWASMPVLEVIAPQQEDAADLSGDQGGTQQLIVRFRDLRFMGGWMRDNHRSALSGTVWVDSSGHVLRQEMDGRVER